MNDDLMPNNGTYFMPREPEEQVIARKKETAQTLEGISVLKDMVTRLQIRIDFYEKNSSIPDNVRADAEKFMVMSNTHALVTAVLISEKEWIQDLLDSHAKNR